MAINWSALRVWDGSRETAFEELSCQLAAGERPAPGARFVRKGTPDAGVECFWELPGGDEYCWQAKFFDAPPTPSQWAQIDDSVETALDLHPQLIRYTVCMPLDRSDSRLVGRRSFLARWDEHVAKWKKWAAREKRTVEFEYWGNHELEARLSRDENRGRYWFWFDTEQFTLDWFRTQLHVAIENAGERYTPELNVELPIATAFEALGRTPAFHARIGKAYDSVRQALQRIAHESEKEDVRPALVAVHNAAAPLFETFEGVILLLDEEPQVASCRDVPWAELREQSAKLADELSRLRCTVRQLADERRKLPDRSVGDRESEARFFDDLSARAAEAYVATSRLIEFSKSAEATVANRPALLLVGGAGQGKTHLLCDIAKHDLQAGRPRLLLHGSHFTDSEPWSQIATLLGLQCSTDELLGALATAGQACGSRVLILVDALNEGDGRTLWRKHLAGMVARIAPSPWLGIAVSVRDTYVELVVPERLVPERLTRVDHPGFREHEYEAVSRFFTHFQILPTAPLLLPEFSNPLFLKLFCQSVRNLGLHHVPVGMRGVTAILNAFLDATNKRLAEPGRLDYDEKAHPVRKAADAVVELIAETGSYWIPRDRAVAAVNRVHPSQSNDRSLFQNLVREGLFSESRWHLEGGITEVVHFAYERFADHLLAGHLLDRYLVRASPSKAFGPRARIGRLFKSEAGVWEYGGLIEALSVQLPERVGKELVELAPHLKGFDRVERAFVQSLVWRDSKAFRRPTFTYLESIWRFERVNKDVLDAMLTVAPVPGHPLNADKLHGILLHQTMAVRDAWWSVFLSREWRATRAVRRLVDWTWGDSDKTALTDEVVMLTGTALAWFLTSAHPYLRDRATKALVRLFESRVRLLPGLLAKFREVDDPYVTERLVAACYGCAMRARDSAGLKELAQEVAGLVFGNAAPRPHLLTRDYGRCVIELARHRAVIPPDAFGESFPPYKSRWPEMRIPTEKVLKKWGNFKDRMSEEERAQWLIYWGVTDRHFSDFGKHVGDLTSWTNVRLGTHPPKTTKERFDEFVGKLSRKQERMFCGYLNARSAADRQQLERRRRILERLESGGCPDLSDEHAEADVGGSEREFVKALTGSRSLKREFRECVKPYIENPERYRLDYAFDADAARRWMVQRVIDYGWTAERFGQFDAHVDDRYYRQSEEVVGERIGEKYQRIAYQELLARLADNFCLRKDPYQGNELSVYSGPSDIGFGHERDIDPAIAIRKTLREWNPTTASWWSPIVYSDWRRGHDDDAWLRSGDGLPPVPKMLAVHHPQDGSLWYVLNTHVHWRQPAPPGRSDVYPHRSLYLILTGYLVRKADAGRFNRWAVKQHFMNRWMPEAPDIHDVSLGEFYWAPEFQAWKAEWGPDWRGRDSDYLPNEVMVTTLDYSHEGTASDRSMDDSLRICLPGKELAEGLGLRWSGVEGRFVDRDGRLAACDPSVFEPGPGALVVRGDLLNPYLSDNGLELVWTVLGEKQLIGFGPLDHGWLEVDGAFRLTAGDIVGQVRCEHRLMARDRSRPRRRRRKPLGESS